MKKKILISREIPDIAQELLREKFVVEVNNGPPLTKNEWLGAVKSYHGILSMFNDRLNADILSQAESLEVISNYGIGLDNIDVPFAKDHNIAVYNLPDIVTNSTADLTMGLLLSVARQIIPAQEFVKQNTWTKESWTPALFCGEELHEQTLGIIGFGRIGQAVAKRALGFGLKIKVFTRSPIGPSLELSSQVEQVSFEEVVSESDYLSIHVPLTSETRGFINRQVFSQMKKSAILLNLGRGAIVQTADLLEALQGGMIRAAALDVTEPEPMQDHPLLKLDNCLIVPHIGTATKACRVKMAIQAAQNLIHFFDVKRDNRLTI